VLSEAGEQWLLTLLIMLHCLHTAAPATPIFIPSCSLDSPALMPCYDARVMAALALETTQQHTGPLNSLHTTELARHGGVHNLSSLPENATWPAVGAVLTSYQLGMSWQ
jgi:hypothetical protein